jgi:hypothetical protein
LDLRVVNDLLSPVLSPFTEEAPAARRPAGVVFRGHRGWCPGRKGGWWRARETVELKTNAQDQKTDLKPTRRQRSEVVNQKAEVKMQKSEGGGQWSGSGGLTPGAQG